MAGLADRQKIFAKNVANLINYIFSEGYSCTFGEAYRTKEQAELYAQSGKGILISLHCKRLALDLNLFSPLGEYLTDSKDYEKFGHYWEGLHKDNRSGCFFKNKKDGNHFEMKDGRWIKYSE